MEQLLSPVVVAMPLGIYTPTYGSFGVFQSKKCDFVTCREKLQDRMDGGIAVALQKDDIQAAKTAASFLFCTTVDPQIFANVLARVERHIGVTELSTVYATSVKCLIKISPNQFWSSAIFRMSFLSIVCRSINNNFNSYEPIDSWYNRLMNERYFVGTHSATKLFLDGHTYNDKYVVNSGQWVNIFRDMNPEAASTVLLNPKTFNHEQYLGLVNNVTKRLSKSGLITKSHRKSAEIICSFAARR